MPLPGSAAFEAPFDAELSPLSSHLRSAYWTAIWQRPRHNDWSESVRAVYDRGDRIQHRTHGNDIAWLRSNAHRDRDLGVRACDKSEQQNRSEQ
jgi:hypothetical protein